MATDYDAPRRGEKDDSAEDSEQRLIASRNDAQTAVLDVAEADEESFELPGADLSGEELMVTVLPQQRDEFTCAGCYLVIHRSRLAAHHHGQPLCKDCA
jgi:hypothetical protein